MGISKIKMVLITLFNLLQCFSISFSFNLSPKFHMIFSEPTTQTNSYFGYSVHLRSGVNQFMSSVVIGAPKANSTFPNHKNITEPGVVFQCDIHDNNRSQCNPLLLDPTGEIFGTIDRVPFIHGKSNSWLGATIDGENSRNGQLMVCSPRWINRHHIEKSHKHPLAVGMCYLNSNTRLLNETAKTIIPFLNPFDEEKNFVAETGLSLHMVEGSGTFLMGAVGLNYWTGGLVVFKDNPPKMVIHYGQAEYYSYLGYSVSSGKIERNGRIVYFAAAPKPKGRIYVFNENLRVLLSDVFIGEQLGEYYGTSLCVLDVNGDGLDDVVVGAPKHSIDSSVIESGDEGAVYVYINNDNLKFHKGKLTSRQKPRAEFGTSIVSLGDLDKDGFNDVAVGAPYEDDGRGAIYIYMGSSTGLNTEYSQHIRAKHIDANLYGFGISLSKGVDIDENYYNDLAVGSYKSGHVVLFRSHPVIHIRGKIITDSNEITRNTTRFSTLLCLQYHGQDVEPNVQIEINYNADILYRRAIIEEAKNYSMNRIISLTKNIQSCMQTNILITVLIQDFSNPIDLELKYNIHNDKDQTKFCRTCPMVNPLAQTSMRIQVPYVTGCGGRTCKPDLKISGEISDQIIIGTNSAYLNISLTNVGEPAFVTRLIISASKLLGFVQIPSNCREMEDLDMTTIRIGCEFNQVLLNEQKTIALELNIFGIKNDLTPLAINLLALSAGKEQNEIDNNITLPLNIVSKYDLKILGNTTIEQLRIDKREDNRTLIHEYIIENLGPSPINAAVVEVHIPVVYGNSTLLHVFKPKNALCYASSPGFLTNPDKDDMKEKEEERISPMFTRDVKEITESEMQNKGTFALQDTNFNINRTIYFNCSKKVDQLECMTVRCELPVRDGETTTFVKIQMEPQIDNIEKILGEKDTLQMDIIAIVEPSRKTNLTRGSVTTTGLTIMRIPSDESCPIMIIILAVILGVIILSLIVTGLWKYGFFERNRKENLLKLQNEEMNLQE